MLTAFLIGVPVVFYLLQRHSRPTDHEPRLLKLLDQKSLPSPDWQDFKEKVRKEYASKVTASQKVITIKVVPIKMPVPGDGVPVSKP